MIGDYIPCVQQGNVLTVRQLAELQEGTQVLGWFIPLLARFATPTRVYSKHIW
jgi:hypothetical protein